MPEPNPETLEHKIPETYHGWERTRFTNEEIVWWKKGCGHVVADYEKLRIQYSDFREAKWSVYLKQYDKYGNSIGSRTLYEKRISLRPDALKACLRTGKERMENYPSQTKFDSQPTLPDEIGEWELERDELTEKSWTTSDESVVVSETAVEGGYCGGRRYYDVHYERGEERIQIVSDEIIQRCLRAAIRFMTRYRSGGVGSGETYQELCSIRGVGPVKAKKLQTQGIVGKNHLHAVCENLEFLQKEHREGVSVVITSMIQESVAEAVKESVPESIRVSKVPDEIGSLSRVEPMEKVAETTRVVWEGFEQETVKIERSEEGGRNVWRSIQNGEIIVTGRSPENVLSQTVARVE